MTPTIKEISAEETYTLRHTVMWPNKPIAYIQLAEDNKGIHFGLYVKEQLVTVCSLFIENQSAQFRKLATLTQEQGKGYASRMIEHIIAYAKEQNARDIWCNARANKTSFYKKFNLEETEHKYTKGEIDFIIMKRTL